LSKRFTSDELRYADLVVDAIYEWGPTSSFADEPLKKLLSCSNTGGFRPKKKRQGRTGDYAYVVLYSTVAELDWPDNLDGATGLFTYYGDNRRAGHELHEARGNQLLRSCYGNIGHREGRSTIPPFLVFTKLPYEAHARFRGLAVPGHPSKSPAEQLVAIWKSSGEDRFQNYKALFTILAIPVIEREFIDELLDGKQIGNHAPEAWRVWVEEGKYRALEAPQTRIHRSRNEQLPKSGSIQEQVLMLLWKHFETDWRAFEHFSARLVRLMGFKVSDMTVIGRSRDGGVDAIGRLALGHGVDDIEVDFALQAKRYRPGRAINVKETSRLISRLKYRQLGMVVTTSYVGPQAYNEIRADGHPVIIVSGVDTANILIEQGLGKQEDLKGWLNASFPINS